MKVPLHRIAHGRSGDKGDVANVGIIAREARWYPILVRELTAERVKSRFGDLVRGRVDRYEMPNIGALNFVLRDALGGGVTRSLALDAHGKSHSSALLDLDIPDRERISAHPAELHGSTNT